jgi:hypothetical protein
VTATAAQQEILKFQAAALLLRDGSDSLACRNAFASPADAVAALDSGACLQEVASIAAAVPFETATGTMAHSCAGTSYLQDAGFLRTDTTFYAAANDVHLAVRYAPKNYGPVFAVFSAALLVLALLVAAGAHRARATLLRLNTRVDRPTGVMLRHAPMAV